MNKEIRERQKYDCEWEEEADMEETTTEKQRKRKIEANPEEQSLGGRQNKHLSSAQRQTGRTTHASLKIAGKLRDKIIGQSNFS